MSTSLKVDSRTYSSLAILDHWAARKQSSGSHEMIKHCAVGLSAMMISGGFAVPAAANDFYAGKTIDLIIGTAPGGGIDVYGRAIARHLGRNIPGNPTIVAKNMP